MKAVRASAITLGVAAVALACELSPTAPPPASSGAQTAPTALLACSELLRESVTQVIGPAGGTIRIGPHALLIPAGALAKSVSITAAIETGRGEEHQPKKGFVAVNSIRFKPRLKFQAPARLTMSYANCAGGDRPSLRPTIVYTNPVLNVILEREASVADSDAQTVTAWIDHFSNYAVAW